MTEPIAARRPNLPAATRALRRAIGRLTTPTKSYINNTFIESDGLYVQLRIAIRAQQGSGNGRAARSLPPVWIDATDLLHNIDLMVATNFTPAEGVGTLARLRDLAGKDWTVEQIKQVRRLAGIVDAWADDIEALLNHDHVKYLTAPCPQCRAETVQHRDSAGELIRAPALQIVTEKGCTCLSCGYFWEPKHYLDLIDQLGFARPAGVLE